MSRLGDVYENRVTGEHALVLRGDEDGGGQPTLVALTVRPGGAVAGEHVHPRVTERFHVVSGRLGLRLGGRESTLSAGQGASAPAGVTHDWWNAGDRDAVVIVEITPPDPRFEQMIATLFGLANAGRVNAKGLPGPCSWRSSDASSATSSASPRRRARCSGSPSRCSGRSAARAA